MLLHLSLHTFSPFGLAAMGYGGTVRPNQQEDSLEQEEWSGKPSREKPRPVNTVMFDHDRVPKRGIPGVNFLTYGTGLLGTWDDPALSCTASRGGGLVMRPRPL